MNNSDPSLSLPELPSHNTEADRTEVQVHDPTPLSSPEGQLAIPIHEPAASPIREDELPPIPVGESSQGKAWQISSPLSSTKPWQRLLQWIRNGKQSQPAESPLLARRFVMDPLPERVPLAYYSMQNSLGRFLLILLSIGLIIGSIIAFFSGSSNAINEMHTRSFALKPTKHPRLVINDSTGVIHILHSSQGPFSMQATEYVSGSGLKLGSMDVNVAEQGDTMVVNAGVSGSILFFGTKRVDLEIVAPDTIDLEVHDSTGSIQVDGVHGALQLTTGSGSLIVNNAAGPLLLQTETGPITVKGFAGSATVSSQRGEIYISQAALRGQASFATANGSITFNGTLDGHGSYQFVANNGAVDLTLPSTSAFRLSTIPDSGPLNNEFGRASIGRGAQAKLLVGTQSGAISLHKQP